jgi:hypothetical protein
MKSKMLKGHLHNLPLGLIISVSTKQQQELFIKSEHQKRREYVYLGILIIGKEINSQGIEINTEYGLFLSLMKTTDTL